MKLDDGAEGDLADLRVHLPEGRAVALQGLHDPEQGPVDGRTRDLAVHDSLLAAGLLSLGIVNEVGVVAENGNPGEVLPGRRPEIEGHGRARLGPGVDLADVSVQPDVSHGRLVLGQSPGLVAKQHRGGA